MQDGLVGVNIALVSAQRRLVKHPRAILVIHSFHISFTRDRSQCATRPQARMCKYSQSLSDPISACKLRGMKQWHLEAEQISAIDNIHSTAHLLPYPKIAIPSKTQSSTTHSHPPKLNTNNLESNQTKDNYNSGKLNFCVCYPRY